MADWDFYEFDWGTYASPEVSADPWANQYDYAPSADPWADAYDWSIPSYAEPEYNPQAFDEALFNPYSYRGYEPSPGKMPAAPGAFTRREREGDLDYLNRMLSSPLGRAGGAGIAGLGSMLAARLFAGSAPKPPTFTMPGQGPVMGAGQNAVLGALGAGGQDALRAAALSGLLGTQDIAELYRAIAAREGITEAQMAPGFEQARMTALANLTGRLTPGEDPVAAALRQEFLDTAAGKTNPQVEAQIQQRWRVLQNDMFKRLGPDWEMSSAGAEAKEAFNREADMLRFNARQSTMLNLAPAETARIGGMGNERRADVASYAGATGLGRYNPGQVGGWMNTIVPVGTWLGGDQDRYRGMEAQLGYQAALLPYTQQAQERRDLYQGIGGLGGLIAGQLGRSNFEDLFRNTNPRTQIAWGA